MRRSPGRRAPGPWFLLAPLLGSALLGCAHDAGPAAGATASKPAAGARPGSAASRYFPLAVGNRWTYEATYLGERSTRGVGRVGFGDGSCLDREGRALGVDGEGLRDQTRSLLHEPLVAGSTWTSVVAPGSAEHYRVVSVGAPCEAPAGKFPDCIEVESR